MRMSSVDMTTKGGAGQVHYQGLAGDPRPDSRGLDPGIHLATAP